MLLLLWLLVLLLLLLLLLHQRPEGGQALIQRCAQFRCLGDPGERLECRASPGQKRKQGGSAVFVAAVQRMQRRGWELVSLCDA